MTAKYGAVQAHKTIRNKLIFEAEKFPYQNPLQLYNIYDYFIMSDSSEYLKEQVDRYTFEEVSKVFPNIISNPLGLSSSVAIYTAFGGVNYCLNDGRVFALAGGVYLETYNGPHEDSIPLSELHSLEEAIEEERKEGDLAVPDNAIRGILTPCLRKLVSAYGERGSKKEGH